MSRRRIQRFQAGQTVISAVRLNEIVDALNELMPVQGDGKLIGVEQRGVGGTTIKWTGPTVDSLGGFEAVIDTDGYDDFTGPTYWVKEAYCSNAARVGGNVASGASAEATVVSSANDVLQLKGKDSATGRRVVATSLAEIANPTSSTPTGTHGLIAGLPVRVWVTWSLSPDGTSQVAHYYFWSSASLIGIFKVDSYSGNGGGKYNGKTTSGSSTAVPTGTLAMPEGLTVASTVDSLLLNMPETGSNTHTVPLGSFVIGVKVGVTTESTPRAIVCFMGPGANAGVFPVRITQNTGSQGDDSTQASYKYRVYALDGTTALDGGSPIVLTRPRDVGEVIVQSPLSYGLAFFDGSTLRLWDAGETYLTNNCTGE